MCSSGTLEFEEREGGKFEVRVPGGGCYAAGIAHFLNLVQFVGVRGILGGVGKVFRGNGFI